MPTATAAPTSYAPAARGAAKRPPDTSGLTRRQRLDRMFAAHWSEMAGFRGQWQAINDAMCPSRAKWLGSTTPTAVSQGRILNNVAGRARRTWSAGAMSGLSPPSRPWFELTTTDQGLDAQQAVKVWLTDVRDRILVVMDRSNFYTEAEIIYDDAALFGTAAMMIERDVETTIRCEAQAIGSYAIAHDGRRRVNHFLREWSATASQMMGDFGYANLSPTARQAIEGKTENSRFTVRHAIYPNDDYSVAGGKVDATRKLYRECYWEPATQPDAQDRYLRESGYDSFPLAVPRWGPLRPSDVYGTDCPGMMTLGDTLMLNEMERQGLNGLRKLITPPTVSGPGFRNKTIYSVPGANNVEDVMQGEPTLRAMYQLSLPLDHLSAEKERVEARIEAGWFVDIMAPLLQRLRQEGEQPTAAQAYMARDEQYGMLGPVVERFGDDFHDPSVDRIFGIMWEAGEIPPPPIEMQGRPLRVRLVSTMAAAQKAVGVTAIERHLQFATSVAASAPQLAAVLDTVDGDEAMRLHATATGVPPSLSRDAAGTAAIREARQRAQQAAQLAAALPGAARAAESLGKTDMTKDSALTRLLGASSGAR